MTAHAQPSRLATDPARAKRLMRAVVSFTAERWPNASRFIDLCNAEAGRDPETRIMFLTSVRKIISDMPVKVFIDMEQRDNVLIAVQDALDELIDDFESGESE
jgi:type III secretion system TyeA family effector delivery regulator